MNNHLKNHLLGAVFLLATSAIGAGAASDTPAQIREKAAVRQVEELVASATTVAAGLSTFDPNALQDDFFAPQRHGVHEIAQDYAVYMDNFTSFHADILDMQIDLQGDLAVAYSHQHFTAAGKNGKPPLDAFIRQTDILRKKAGKWLITCQHLSLPIDIHTGKAVFKP